MANLNQAPAPARVHLTYEALVGDHREEHELPLKLLVLGDFTGRIDDTPVAGRRILNIDRDSFDQVLAGLQVRLAVTVDNCLATTPAVFDIELKISQLDDFSPGRLALQIPVLRALIAQRERWTLAKTTAVGADGRTVEHETADSKTADLDIAELDQRLGKQLDAVLHHPAVQRLEAAWRALALLVTRTDVRENTRICVLNVARDDLQADFEDAPETVRSGLYHHVYATEYGQFGGEPYAAIIADYAFGPSPRDLALLQRVAAVAAMAHAPFIAAASPSFFGFKSHAQLPDLADVESLWGGPQFAGWRSFRASDDARCVALALPRFLLRVPYGPATAPVRDFPYTETVHRDHAAWLWGNPAFAFATRLTASFAATRWCPDVIGPHAGLVSGLPHLTFAALGWCELRIPTECVISERLEFALSNAGFLTLAVRPGSADACFFSAPSCQSNDSNVRGDAAVNHRLGGQLPYLLIANRLAHYLKVIQREQLGSFKQRGDLERELGDWIGRYVVDMDEPELAVRGTHPLRSARVIVEDVPGNAGWYRVALQVRPHLKHLGTAFTLSLVGKLDIEQPTITSAKSVRA